MDIGRQPKANHRYFLPLDDHAKEICLLCLQTWAHPVRASLHTPTLGVYQPPIPPQAEGEDYFVPPEPSYRTRVSALSPPGVHHLCSLLLLPDTYREGLQFLYIPLLWLRLDGPGLQVMTVQKLQLPRPSSPSPLSLASRQLSTSLVPLLLESLWLLLRSLHSIFVTSLF